MNTISKIIIFTIAIIFSTAANANKGDLLIMTPIGSYHFDRSKEWCEVNPGVGVQYFAGNNVYVSSGLYYNSHCTAAPYLMGGIESNTNKIIGIGLSAAVAGGYKNSKYPTVPFIAFPYVRIGSNHDLVSARVMFIPDPNNGVVGLTLNWRIKND